MKTCNLNHYPITYDETLYYPLGTCPMCKCIDQMEYIAQERDRHEAIVNVLRFRIERLQSRLDEVLP